MGWGTGKSLVDLIAQRNQLASNRVNGTAPPLPVPPAATTVAGSGAVPRTGGRKPPPGAPVVGKAVSREDYIQQQSQPSVNPGSPSAPTLPPAATSALGSAADRMRRRMAAGSAGRVSTGAISGAQAGIRAITAPRTLIGS